MSYADGALLRIKLRSAGQYIVHSELVEELAPNRRIKLWRAR